MRKAADLDAQLLAAHADADQPRLVALYTQAADLAEETGDLDRTCFYLTHAYVFALEVAHPALPDLAARLKSHGRI